jgi:hypothetical protein
MWMKMSHRRFTSAHSVYYQDLESRSWSQRRGDQQYGRVIKNKSLISPIIPSTYIRNCGTIYWLTSQNWQCPSIRETTELRSGIRESVMTYLSVSQIVQLTGRYQGECNDISICVTDCTAYWQVSGSVMTYRSVSHIVQLTGRYRGECHDISISIAQIVQLPGRHQGECQDISICVTYCTAYWQVSGSVMTYLSVPQIIQLGRVPWHISLYHRLHNLMTAIRESVMTYLSVSEFAQHTGRYQG